MNEARRESAAFSFDDSAGRLAWIIPAALILWAVTLTIFALLLERTAAPAPEFKPLRAQLIVEPPAPAVQKAAPKRAPVIAPPQVVKPPPLHRAMPHVVPRAPSPNGIAKVKKRVQQPPPPAASPEATPAASTSENSADTSGLGNAAKDNSGASAIYAPTPEIPDDLRDNPIDTVAVAHFVVDADGEAQVTLSQPTANPELNAALLETLRKWRFTPAMRDGAATASQFDVRIPITVN